MAKITKKINSINSKTQSLFNTQTNLKELKKKALKHILKEIESQKEFLPIKKNFEIVVSLSTNNKIDEAKLLLNKLIKYQTRNGDFEYKINGLIKKREPIYFLLAITKFITNARHNNPKILKKYIKPIKKSLIYLDKNLDKTYLLIGTTKFTKTKFNNKANALIISITNELSDLLNEVGYHKQADNLFMLKGKLELGVKRYFWNFENKIVLKSFKNDFSFKIANLNEILDIMSFDIFDNEYLKEILKSEKKQISNNKNISSIINYLYLLKKFNSKEFNLLFKQSYNLLIQFPKTQEKIKDYKIYEIIKKSLDFNFKPTKVYKLNNKKVLIDINSIETCNNILRLV